MTDIQAAIGLVELNRYDENIDRRKTIFSAYEKAFSAESWAILPSHKNSEKTSSYHLYLLRINGITESERDAIIQEIFEQEVSVNVHFQPLPLLTAYKNLGYDISDYPIAHNKYQSEITLPVYYNLTDDQTRHVIEAVKNAVQKIRTA